MYHTISKFHTSVLSLILDNNVLFLINLYNQSNGFHEINVLKTSCSIINLSISVDFSTFFNGILFSSSQNNHWLALAEFDIQLMIASILFQRTLRSSNESSAQDFINHSKLFLFKTFEHLLQKSSRDVYSHHLFLSSWISSQVSNHTHLIEMNQILTLWSMAATWLNDTFTSGCKISIHFCCISEK